MKYAVLAARLLIGGLFVYAGMYKVLDPGSFAPAIRNYMILPPAVTNAVAVTLPWIELAAGLMLILGLYTRPAALVTTGLLGVFLAAIGYAYVTGLDIDCGCFSSPQGSSGHIDFLTLARESSLFLISLFVLGADRGFFSLHPGQGQTPRTSVQK